MDASPGSTNACTLMCVAIQNETAGLRATMRAEAVVTEQIRTDVRMIQEQILNSQDNSGNFSQVAV